MAERVIILWCHDYVTVYLMHCYLFSQFTIITGMIGYGMAKAAVHQLVASLAQDNSGLPANSLVAAILP